MELQPLEIKDFSGGLSDNPMTAAPNQYVKADNLLHHPNGGMISRPGSELLDSTHSRPVADRIGELFNFMRDKYLLARSGSKLYRYVNATLGWQQIAGPSHDALAGATTTDKVSAAQWKDHLFLVPSSGQKPVKVFRNNIGNFKCVTAGLPVMPDPIYCVTTAGSEALFWTKLAELVNDLTDKMVAHFNSTASHTIADTASSAKISPYIGVADPSYPDELITQVNLLIQTYADHFSDATSAGKYHSEYSQHPTMAVATLADMKLESQTPATTLFECIALMNDLLTKLNTHIVSKVLHNGTSGSNISIKQPLEAYKGPVFKSALPAICTYANSIRAKFNAHLNDAPNSNNAHKAINSANIITTGSVPDATDWLSLQLLVDNLRRSYFGTGTIDGGAHYCDSLKGASSSFHINDKSSGHELSQSYFPNTKLYENPPQVSADPYGGLMFGNTVGYVAQLNELKNAINGHMSDFGSHYSTDPGGLLPNLIPSSDLTLANYNYAFVYCYSYNVGNTVFDDFGPPLVKAAKNVISISNQSMVISHIPFLTNGTYDNYDTGNITIKIYRTTNNGTTYYFVGEVNNGVTTYTDNIADSELQTREQMYTSGGVPDNDPPPVARYLHIVNGFAYYADVVDADSSQRVPNRIRQSVQEDPDSCPADFYVDLPDDVLGISSAGDVPVAWTKNKTFRLEGSFDELGRGAIKAVAISDSVGLAASYGIVQIDGGVAFCGTDGFYVTEGYSVKKLSSEWLSTYFNLIATDTRMANIQGTYDRLNRRVYWAVTSNGTENDSLYVLDLNKPMTDNCAFTSASGGDSFKPTAICMFGNKLIRGDSRGYIFQHDSTLTSDPKVESAALPANWIKQPITYDFISPAYDFNAIQIKKWVPVITMKAKRYGNLSLQINGINDDGRFTGSCFPIRYRGLIGLIEEKRRFPSNGLRCFNKQVQFTNAKVVMIGSDNYGQAVLDKVAKTLTLQSGSWPTDLAGQWISFASDSYTAEWAVASVSGAVMTITDASGTLPASGTYKWEVKGYPKDEIFHLLSYVLHCTMFGVTASDASGDSGANA